ncbi:hypothetical protein [Streptomyces sp. KL116D]|uniref:hypothetical protein n=1 Tax=Streptomyces sp. KL116D TaxID=3045152 RepID=UPI003558941D
MRLPAGTRIALPLALGDDVPSVQLLWGDDEPSHQFLLAALLAAAALALTACTADNTPVEAEAQAGPTKSAAAPSRREHRGAGGPHPAGTDRSGARIAAEDPHAAANPDIVKYEDKAVDAARNLRAAINGGAGKLDWSAGRRFTYKDVTTPTAQGAQINFDSLRPSRFCQS